MGKLGSGGHRWRAFVVALVVTGLLVGFRVSIASGSAAEAQDRCARFAAVSNAREAGVDGASGRAVLVIGDSWSVGLGLADPSRSWPAQLSGDQVRVDGFSGSGYAATASRCAGASFAQRARQAARRDYDLVVVEGGLNDFDRPSAEVRSGVRAVLAAFEGTPVVLVGPASAPARRRGVPRIDALLAAEAARAGARYVSTKDLALAYLPDRLHLTPEGHQQFGEFVATAIARRP
ncbi:SGNH/GDSL hydrolase family protein [Nocardioides cavernaquae]|uniref:SGNH/GDSL hydrolase family protein n=1 Tax=Nocardioides cavernaquae TaxID=2321396 RepID=UPI00160117F0|nr:SGNH/GDSL hydrolase family protein [Nocardioides cavernaquae]